MFIPAAATGDGCRGDQAAAGHRLHIRDAAAPQQLSSRLLRGQVAWIV